MSGAITWDATMEADSPQAQRLAHECTCDAEQLCDDMPGCRGVHALHVRAQVLNPDPC
jgi:hypothetical protein